MALKANYEFLFVGHDDNSFLENYVYDLFEEHGEKSGQIFVNLEIQNNQVDAEEIAKAVFETMQKVFFEDVERDPYERFEASLKAVNEVLAQFKAQKFSGYIGNLNVIVSAIVGDNLYVTQCGDAEAYLVRKRYVSVVSEGLSDEGDSKAEVFSSIASGKIETDDFVLFSSTRLLRYISKNDMAKCLGRKNVVDALNEVRDVISTEMLGRVGLTGMVFSIATREEVKATGDEVDTATMSILESNENEVSYKKDSATGRFFTALKNYKRRGARGDGVFSVFGEFFSKVGNYFKFLGGALFSKGFGRDKVLALLILVIIVLTVGIWIAKSNGAEKAEIARLDAVLTSVQEKVSEADTKGVTDKESAKTILDKAYSDAMTVLNSGYYREKAKLYLIQIEQTRDKLDNVKRIADPKLYIDLSVKRPGASALGFVAIGDRVFVYEYNALYEIVLNQLQDPMTIDDEETVFAAAGFDDRGSIVFMTKSGKLLEYKEGTVSFMDTDDGTFHKGVAIASWSNRVYMLDSANNQIWKYTYKGASEKFGAAEGYLTETLDLSKAQDIAIDSNVYVLQNNGEIMKFYAGKKVPLYINNAPFSFFKDPTVIYTNEKLDDVYVLDSQGGRVLVFGKDTKTGNLDYKMQYLFDGVGEVRDLYVDVNSKKLYVLTAGKVFETDL